jgi:hypothetical protein
MGLPTSLPRVRLVRNVDAGSFLESFLAAAVAAVLGIRFYLEIAGYPQIGGAGLHIAHMLWGGLLMLVAIVVLLAFLGKPVQHFATIVGGIGFGAFIDELGKFITSDNNYFFQPTIALIYATFVALFLAFRVLERRQQLSEAESLANAVDLLREVVLRPDSVARDRAVVLLAHAGETPTAQAIRAVIEQTVVAPPLAPSAGNSIARRARAAYRAIIRASWFDEVIVIVFLLHSIVATCATVLLIVTDPEYAIAPPAMSFTDWGDTIATALSSLMVVLGVASLRMARLLAYYWFKRSILVAIFLTQFFAFYTQQLGALVGLAIDVTFLGALNYLISQEHAISAARTADRALTLAASLARSRGTAAD